MGEIESDTGQSFQKQYLEGQDTSAEGVQHSKSIKKHKLSAKVTVSSSDDKKHRLDTVEAFIDLIKIMLNEEIVSLADARYSGFFFWTRSDQQLKLIPPSMHRSRV
jgi:hypothetical protein